MGATRKKEIYNICVEYGLFAFIKCWSKRCNETDYLSDILIVEDDPYYFLQQGPYVPPQERKKTKASNISDDETAYIASLAPSYLKFDYQGRVVRLDTFSKTIAPGSRLGWFTCNEVFAERLERQGETSTQAPCGFGQVCLLHEKC